MRDNDVGVVRGRSCCWCHTTRDCAGQGRRLQSKDYCRPGDCAGRTGAPEKWAGGGEGVRVSDLIGTAALFNIVVPFDPGHEHSASTMTRCTFGAGKGPCKNSESLGEKGVAHVFIS